MKREPDPNDLIDIDELADLLREREGPPRPLRRQRVRRPLRVALALGLFATAAAAVIAIAVAITSERDRAQNTSKSGVTYGAVCVAAVEWQGVTYRGDKLNQPARLGRSLGEGSIPNCSDTNLGNGTPAQTVAIVAIADLPTQQAVAVAGDPTHAYIAPGYFPQLPHTALHDLLYGPRNDLPDERGNDCNNAETTEITATVRSANGGFLSVTGVDSPGLPHQTPIFPDARTVIEGGGAEPHVNAGDTIRAQVFVCRHPNDAHFLKLVATRIAIGETAPGG
jgi:hypothetical protein